jgi:hypothetical protein
MGPNDGATLLMNEPNVYTFIPSTIGWEYPNPSTKTAIWYVPEVPPATYAHT